MFDAVSDPLKAKILEESRDQRLFRFLSGATRVLSEYNIPFVAIGSCAVFASLGVLVRLTRDLDIVVPRREHSRLYRAFEGDACHSAIERGFLRIFCGHYQVHVVPEDFELIDPGKRSYLGTVDFRPLLENTEERRLKFPTLGSEVNLWIPSAGHMIAISLLRPLDVNVLSDVEALLSQVKDFRDTQEFLRLNKKFSRLYADRLVKLRNLLPEGHGGKIDSLIEFVVALAKGPPEDDSSGATQQGRLFH